MKSREYNSSKQGNKIRWANVGKMWKHKTFMQKKIWRIRKKNLGHVSTRSYDQYCSFLSVDFCPFKIRYQVN